MGKMKKNQPEPKRDFIFIDESGDPGKATDYYIAGLLHITDVSLRQINPHLGALRYFGFVRKELKSTQLGKVQKDQILNILKIAFSSGFFVKTTAVYVDKDEYEGPYLGKNDFNPNFFRNLILRKLLEFHFENVKPQSKEIEIVIDRIYSSEELEQRLRNYLRTDKYNRLPKFLHIIQADSRYVECLQIADWVSGMVKEKYFTHPERELEEIFDYVNVKQILR